MSGINSTVTRVNIEVSITVSASGLGLPTPESECQFLIWSQSNCFENFFSVVPHFDGLKMHRTEYRFLFQYMGLYEELQAATKNLNDRIQGAAEHILVFSL